jgi:hypothetical protein
MAALQVLLFAAVTAAQGTKYGNNHVTVTPDSQIVEQRAFPAPNVTLYSPAFLPNASFDPGWSKGTKGATSQADLSKFAIVRVQFDKTFLLTHQQRSSSKVLLRRIRHGRCQRMPNFSVRRARHSPTSTWRRTPAALAVKSESGYRVVSTATNQLVMRLF